SDLRGSRETRHRVRGLDPVPLDDVATVDLDLPEELGLARPSEEIPGGLSRAPRRDDQRAGGVPARRTLDGPARRLLHVGDPARGPGRPVLAAPPRHRTRCLRARQYLLRRRRRIGEQETLVLLPPARALKRGRAAPLPRRAGRTRTHEGAR